MDPSSSSWILKQGYLLLIAETLAVSSVVAAVLYHVYAVLISKPRAAVRSGSRWPPSPPAWPIIGHLHLLRDKPHRDLHAISLKFGPLYYLRLGSTHTLVVSSAGMAREVLKVHDRAFASRVTNGASVEIFSHQSQDLAGAPYGPHWRHMRKLCLLEIFSSKRIESFAYMRDGETSSLVRDVLEESLSGKPVVMTLKFTQTTLNIISLMTMGKRLIEWGSEHVEDEAELREFRGTITEMFNLCGIVSNLGDYFPSLRWLDLQGYERRMRKVVKEFDAFVLKLVRHKFEQNKQSVHHRDLLDVLLSLPSRGNGKLSVDIVTAVMLDILSAGVDTSSSTIEWAFTELAKRPEKLKRVQDEVDALVGTARKVEEEDLEHLQYLNAVVKETLRLHPPAPLLLPHESIEPCVLQGYNIPEKTRLYVNVWAIGRDPSSWDNPLDFRPERFLGEEVDVRGHDYQLIPFGSGRRMCPGMSLGLVVTQLTLARLIHSVDFSLPSWQRPEDVDMNETFGLTVFKTVPLQLMAKGRLPGNLY